MAFLHIAKGGNPKIGLRLLKRTARDFCTIWASNVSGVNAERGNISVYFLLLVHSSSDVRAVMSPGAGFE